MKKKTIAKLKEKEERIRMLNGYKVIYKPEHPNAMTSENWKGFVYEHIAVASDEIGRPLVKGEEVHHLDLDRANNNPSNLIVVTSSVHTKIHNWISTGARFTRPVGKHKVAPKRPTRYCAAPDCDNVVKYINNTYCSNECMRRTLKQFRVVKEKTPSIEQTKKESVIREPKVVLTKRPEKEILLEDIKSMSMLAVGSKYGVSDNAVRRWCKKYDILDEAKNRHKKKK